MQYKQYTVGNLKINAPLVSDIYDNDSPHADY